MKPTSTAPVALDPASRQALADARAAVSEHARLSALEAALAADHRAAARGAGDARAALDAAEAELLLSDDAGKRTAEQRAEAARAAAQEADRAVARIEAAQRALPLKLADADGRVAAVHAALETAAAPVLGAALDAYSAELRRATAALADVLMRGYALRAAGVGGLGPHLDEVNVPDPVRDRGALLRGNHLTLGNSTVVLREAWTENAAAAALHRTLDPIRQAMAEMAPSLKRLHERELQARMVGIAAARGA